MTTADHDDHTGPQDDRPVEAQPLSPAETLARALGTARKPAPPDTRHGSAELVAGDGATE